MTISAFIFDLDGTLVDSELIWADAMAVYLAERECACSRSSLLEIVFGHSWGDIHRALTRRFPRLAAIPPARMADELRVYYQKLREKGDSIVIRSSAALLKQLAASHPVIIVSGSPRHDIEEALSLIDAQTAVRFVLGAEDYARGKPAPDGFLLGAQRLGVSPETCLVFEDSWAGVTAAKAAGMWCVALSRPGAHQQDLNAADWILSDLAAFSVEAFERRLRSPSERRA